MLNIGVLCTLRVDLCGVWRYRYVNYVKFIYIIIQLKWKYSQIHVVYIVFNMFMWLYIWWFICFYDWWVVMQWVVKKADSCDWKLCFVWFISEQTLNDKKMKIRLEHKWTLSIMRSSSKGFTQIESSKGCFDKLSLSFLSEMVNLTCLFKVI